MTITRVGTNKKFAEGWSSVFGKGTKAASAKPATTAKKKAAPKKKAAKKAKK